MTNDDQRAATVVMERGMCVAVDAHPDHENLGSLAAAALRALLDTGWSVLPPGWPDDAAMQRAAVAYFLLGRTVDDAMRAAVVAAVGEPPK